MFPKALGLQGECPTLTQPSDAIELHTASAEFQTLVGNRSIFINSTPLTGSPQLEGRHEEGNGSPEPSSEGLGVTGLLDHRWTSRKA